MLKPAFVLESEAPMTAFDAIRDRHSVRSYAKDILSYEVIHMLLRAAVLAPTAVHEEPWAFAVVENREILKRISDSAKKFMDEIEHDIHVPGRDLSSHFVPPEDIFYGAPALIVIYGKPMGAFVAADCWLAAENLMLAATAMGLGTCVIGLAVKALNTPECKAELGIPAEMTAYAPIIVGMPKGPMHAEHRNEPEIIAWK
jgi:nitroreductase